MSAVRDLLASGADPRETDSSCPGDNALLCAVMSEDCRNVSQGETHPDYAAVVSLLLSAGVDVNANYTVSLPAPACVGARCSQCGC